MSDANRVILSCENLTKSYHDGQFDVDVLKGIDFSLIEGESVAITGSSGCGKTTFLQLLAGLDQSTSGSVSITGEVVEQLNARQLEKIRNQRLGFIYQFHHLMPEFTAEENAAMPLLIAGRPKRLALNKAREMLKRVDLGKRSSHKPAELSGGERQRVAIARALINDPVCVFADEPTGNLDQSHADEFYSLMQDLKDSLNTSFLVVTHDLKLAGRMDKQYAMAEGCLQPTC